MAKSIATTKFIASDLENSDSTATVESRILMRTFLLLCLSLKSLDVTLGEVSPFTQLLKLLHTKCWTSFASM